MKCTACSLLAGPALILLFVAPSYGQVPVALMGRVEDASTREPVSGARVFSSDSTEAVLTDSLGAFVLRLSSGDSLAVQVEAMGYVTESFDLPRESLSRPSILLLEPAAIELQGLTVIAEQAIEVLQNNLRNRRNAYWGSMRAYDRSWLDRFAPTGSAYDLLREKMVGSFPCPDDSMELCFRSRSVTIRTGDVYPPAKITVCLDGRNAIAAELFSILIDDIALFEIYGRQGVKVYTQDWTLWSARNGRTSVMPDSPFSLFGLSCG
jgi:hypothetical protein